MESIPTQQAGGASEFRLGGEISIRRMGFGAMRLLRNDWNVPYRDPEIGRMVLRRAIELGLNHIDTADFYRSGDGAIRANALIRETLHPYPAGLLIATKVGPVFGPNGPTRLPRPSCVLWSRRTSSRWG